MVSSFERRLRLMGRLSAVFMETDLTASRLALRVTILCSTLIIYFITGAIDRSFRVSRALETFARVALRSSLCSCFFYGSFLDFEGTFRSSLRKYSLLAR